GAVVAIIAGIVAMWVYAFLFADKSSAAGLRDKQWTARAQAICETRNVKLQENLAAFDKTDGSLAAFHDSVKATTDIVEDALDQVVAVEPNNDRDRRLVDEWERLYRIYIQDRRDTEAKLAAGQNAELAETTLNGSPISATISDFTEPNGMPACGPPFGQ